MNKKMYVAPLIEVTEIELESLMAASTPVAFEGLDDLEKGDETPAEFSKHHDIWDFEE
ncbi:MAG: hypothetical protein IKA00_02475 [Prevotella sp.]|nr:hypothetical protein [Prevotella sp.]MBR2016157.1 hypothetical protein [Prevotella sp.]